MLFNSFEFLVFFVLVYSLYLIFNHKWQNSLLFVASYFFYGFLDWRFLLLIMASTILDFFCGIKISEAQQQRERKLFLFLSLAGNLCILGFFKYFNFFLDNCMAVLELLHISVPSISLKIFLPIGISFYTFKTMSYTIDIYRREIIPTRKFFDYALFVAFFPQLLAGPIERAKHLLPQIAKSRRVTLALFLEGAHLIFYGMFLKIFIADNLAKIVEPIFNPSALPSGAEVLFASYAFCLQVFCDFGGYSHIARGLGKLMGFETIINFRQPFFVTNPQDFWNQWHMSLSHWIRDYVYFPVFIALKNISGNVRVYITILITMTIMGFWHGAAWKYIYWGIYNGSVLLIYMGFRGKFRSPVLFSSPWISKAFLFIRIVIMFHVTMLGFLIFRSAGFIHIGLLTQNLFFNFDLNENALGLLQKLVVFSIPLLLVQLGEWRTNDELFLYRQHWILKIFSYALMTYLMLGFGVMTAEQFIYYQF